jgi:hypothetical protein
MNPYDVSEQVDDYNGVIVTRWPNREPARRYTVLHPKCGVNIKPRQKLQDAQGAASKHSRKCNG